MIKIPFLLMLLFLDDTKTASTTARISLTDKNGRHKSMDLPYTLELQKVNYGTRYGISLFRLQVSSCKLIFPKTIHEYFAAYVVIPPECKIDDIYDEITSHGPNFVFFDLKNILKENQKSISKKVDIPLFFGDNLQRETEFFGDKNNEKVYVEIQFIMVD